MKRVLKTTVCYAAMGFVVGLCSEYAKSIFEDEDTSTEFGDMAPETPVAAEEQETTESNDTPTE